MNSALKIETKPHKTSRESDPAQPRTDGSRRLRALVWPTYVSITQCLATSGVHESRGSSAGTTVGCRLHGPPGSIVGDRPMGIEAPSPTRATDHSLPSGAEISNAGTMGPLLSASSWRCA